MIRTSLPLIVLAAACSADVELDLDGSAPQTPSAPTPLPDPSLGELAWYFTDPGLGGSETMHVDRAPDGSVIAAGHFSRYDGLSGFDSFLARLSADGAPMWVAEIERQDLIDLIGGFGDRVVITAYASIESIASFDDGRTLVAVTLEAGLVLADGLTPAHAELGFLRWYDGDGNLIETRRIPEGDDSLSAPDQTLPRIRMLSLVTLPDGGGVYAWLNRGGPDMTSDIVRFDAEGNEVWTTTTVGSTFVKDLTLTSDGGIVFHGHLVEQVTVGDRTLRVPGGGAFVARLELDDGRFSWLTSFDDAHHLLFRGGIGLAAGGSLVATGLYTYRVGAGEFEIETTEHGNKSFVSVLGPAGDVLSLTSIDRQHPGGAAMEGRWTARQWATARSSWVAGSSVPARARPSVPLPHSSPSSTSTASSSPSGAWSRARTNSPRRPPWRSPSCRTAAY